MISRHFLRKPTLLAATVILFASGLQTALPSTAAPTPSHARAAQASGAKPDVRAAERVSALPTLWAVVRANGTVARSSGLSGVLRTAPGIYEVRFTQDVRGCTYTATVGDPADALVFTPGLVTTASGHRSGGGGYVETKNLGGGLADYPFHLLVTCAGSDRAVVDGAGHLVRGTATGVTRFGPG